MNLALSVGQLDWEPLLDELTPQQLAVLQAHQELNPTGERRQDLRHAHLVSIIANLVRSKDDTHVEPADALAHFLGTLKGKRKPRAIGPDAAAAMIGKALGH